MSLIVRRLGTEDVAVLQQLARESPRFELQPAAHDPLLPLSELDAEHFLDRSDHLVLAAFFEGALVGFALAYELERRDAARPLLFLYEVGVDVGHRRRGIGRALLAAVREHARARRLSGGFVLTEASNRGGMALYREAGGRREREDDVVFVFDPEER
jgi:ribosomal protein S18 acetylase RimI-like enzyme